MKRCNFLHILESFANSVRRKNLVGPQVMPRSLADYGENISNERLNSTSRPSWNIPRNFHFKHYSVLGKNYKNVFHRKTSEGIFINTENPDLNCQVYHKRTSLFCNHFASFGRASDRGITWGPTKFFRLTEFAKLSRMCLKIASFHCEPKFTI